MITCVSNDLLFRVVSDLTAGHETGRAHRETEALLRTQQYQKPAVEA